jgi:hypothetical protein
MLGRLYLIPSLSSPIVSKINNYQQPVKRRANHQRSTGYTNYKESAGYVYGELPHHRHNILT